MPSTAISFFRYENATRRLFVTFVGSGKTYVYFDVPEAAYAEFRAASSKGRYFNAHIRDRYTYEELRTQARARPIPTRGRERGTGAPSRRRRISAR